ncbi:Rop guanine nucleotide exchange factor 1 [Apostasia shenzhenica]|uniref:Rop guanine nucleotide exchange factor 1 n=1 Tax=Apostasia shenzhenica TaxID=1088818 RepID=A0A2I0B8J0_9ASPA|nr:Rop guanine nucleotide exchange factor 1 [Apostasia shenzhenica]
MSSEGRALHGGLSETSWPPTTESNLAIISPWSVCRLKKCPASFAHSISEPDLAPLKFLKCWTEVAMVDSEEIMTYSGLESCILNSYSCDNESGGSGMSRSDGCVLTDSPEEETSSSSSKEVSESSNHSTQCIGLRKQEEEHLLNDWDTTHAPGEHHICSKGKLPIIEAMHPLDVQTMKERFSYLLLGEDLSGGTKGFCTALALSNAITSLSVSVFGELWKLEPLYEERKNRWRREMNWLLSPTNYMVELVPAKQNGSNGNMLEIMIPKARSDVHVNLPALQKLDTMLIVSSVFPFHILLKSTEILDSMVDTEFWYVEGGSRDDGRSWSSGIRPSKKCWLPSPRVPDTGMSTCQRRRLGLQAKIVHQILKASKSINEQVLLQMLIPLTVKDAFPKSGKASLGEHIYQLITTEPWSVEETLLSLNVKSEHTVLESINRLEGALFAWKQRISERGIRRSPIHYRWNFARDPESEVRRMEVWLERADMLVRLLKNRFPNLPQTFIDITKIKYNKDVGHSIIEAYSRVLVNLAFSILSRIGDLLQVDELKKPSTPIANLKFDFFSEVYLAGITETPPGHIRRSLIDQMNSADGRSFGNMKTVKDVEAS